MKEREKIKRNSKINVSYQCVKTLMELRLRQELTGKL